MKRFNKLNPFSEWLRKRKRRKILKADNTQRLSSDTIEFATKSSGFTCRPYESSGLFNEYDRSFEKNLQEQINCMQMDEYNGDFKKLEIQRIGKYEDIYLEQQLIDHKFTNSKINSALLSYKELFENDIKLIEKTKAVLGIGGQDHEG